MKFYPLLLTGMVFTLLCTSCSNGSTSDSKDKADSTNTARIDSAKAADTVASNQNTMADMKQDANFAVAAADAGMLEVALGKLAATKGTSPAVRKFASQMVADHSKTNTELKTLATEKNIAVPKEMSHKCQKALADMKEDKKGKDFDKAYADQMVKDHKDAIDEFKKESEKGTDSQLSAWAKSKIPTLEHHLMMAEEMQKTVEK